MQLVSRTNLLFLLGLVFTFASIDCSAQRRSGVSDSEVVQAAQLVTSVGRIELYQFGMNADPQLAELANKAVQTMEKVLGRPFDVTTYGEKIRVIVTSHTPVSHVWRGYDHQSDPKAILFLNQLAASSAVSGRNATYAHELGHLLTWRFTSHSLREGLADYLALQVHPNAGVGPNPNGYSVPPSVPQSVVERMGTISGAPTELMNDTNFRRAYYYASYRLVNALIQRKGIGTFLELYDAKNSDSQYTRLFGASREEIVAEVFK